MTVFRKSGIRRIIRKKMWNTGLLQDFCRGFAGVLTGIPFFTIKRESGIRCYIKGIRLNKGKRKIEIYNEAEYRLLKIKQDKTCNRIKTGNRHRNSFIRGLDTVYNRRDSLFLEPQPCRFRRSSQGCIGSWCWSCCWCCKGC